MSRRPDGVTETLRIRVHPGLCEAWGNCHRWAPEVYPLAEDGTVDVHMIEVPPEHAVEAWMGAEACPARAITVVGVALPATASRATTKETPP